MFDLEYIVTNLTNLSFVFSPVADQTIERL